MQEFFDMGGYAAFIWPCFIVSAVLLVGLLVVSRRQLNTTQATLTALEAEMPARKDMS